MSELLTPIQLAEFLGINFSPKGFGEGRGYTSKQQSDSVDYIPHSGCGKYWDHSRASLYNCARCVQCNAHHMFVYS